MNSKKAQIEGISWIFVTLVVFFIIFFFVILISAGSGIFKTADSKIEKIFQKQSISQSFIALLKTPLSNCESGLNVEDLKTISSVKDKTLIDLIFLRDRPARFGKDTTKEDGVLVKCFNLILKNSLIREHTFDYNRVYTGEGDSVKIDILPKIDIHREFILFLLKDNQEEIPISLYYNKETQKEGLFGK